MYIKAITSFPWERRVRKSSAALFKAMQSGFLDSLGFQIVFPSRFVAWTFPLTFTNYFICPSSFSVFFLCLSVTCRAIFSSFIFFVRLFLVLFSLSFLHLLILSFSPLLFFVYFQSIFFLSSFLLCLFQFSFIPKFFPSLFASLFLLLPPPLCFLYFV